MLAKSVEQLLALYVGHGLNEISDWGPELSGGCEHALAFGKVAGVPEDERGYGQTVWEGHDRGICLSGIGQLSAELAIKAQYGACFADGMEDEPTEHRWANFVEFEFQRRHHAEVAAAAA